MQRLSADIYIKGVLEGDRMILSRALTLVESSLASDQLLASTVLDGIMHRTGKATRIGITGVPGVGKSTFIDAFGTHLTQMGKQVAVLAIDPSSERTRGSILGDKTRMDRLSRDPLAFVRPSPSGGSLGGATRKTRESILLCEAFGFEVILVETVGVGQSETAVHSMVDFFLLLMLAGAGDELQGIKKGIMEMADGLVINKADGDNVRQAQIAKAEYSSALRLFPHSESGWVPRVQTCSSILGTGIERVWEMIGEYMAVVAAGGNLDRKRQQQRLRWMHETVKYLLEERFFAQQQVQDRMEQFEKLVGDGAMAPTVAARRLLEELG